MNQNIKAVIFDWGGVLIDNPAEKIFELCAEELDVSTENLRSGFKELLNDFQKGIITEGILWKSVCSHLGIKREIKDSIWDKAFRCAYSPKKEMFKLVRDLKSSGYKTGFISNTELPAMAYFQEQKYEMFDVTVFSCYEGICKPEKEIFRLAIDRLNIKPDEGIFIDDNIDFINSAASFGLQTVHFLNPEQVIKLLIEYGLKF